MEPHPDDVREVMSSLNTTYSQAIDQLKQCDNDPIKAIYGDYDDLITCTACEFEFSKADLVLDDEFIHRDWVCPDCELSSERDSSMEDDPLTLDNEMTELDCDDVDRSASDAITHLEKHGERMADQAVNEEAKVKLHAKLQGDNIASLALRFQSEDFELIALFYFRNRSLLISTSRSTRQRIATIRAPASEGQQERYLLRTT